jgi:hypothetical protein
MTRYYFRCLFCKTQQERTNPPMCQMPKVGGSTVLGCTNCAPGYSSPTPHVYEGKADTGTPANER